MGEYHDRHSQGKKMAQITDLLGKAGISMPSMGGVMTGILGFILLLFICGAMVLVTWLILNSMTYNKRIIIFGKVGQHFEPTEKDKAKEMVIGDGGERVLFLKRRKLWKIAEVQASRNTYWFAILDDGYWYNVSLGDLNKDLGEFKVTGISPEMHKLMRYQNAGLRKNLKERHMKKKWYEHPLIGWIGAILFVLVVGIMFVLIGKQYYQQIPQTLSALNTLTERINNLLEAATNLCK